MAYQPCQHLGVQPGKTVRKGEAYRCNVAVQLPDLPQSITKSCNWPTTGRVFYDSSMRSHVGKDDCAQCPLYSPVQP